MILILLLLNFLFRCEGATQNFSVSLASLSPNPLRLQHYGAMETYVAYMPDSSSASAWLLFIPHPHPTSSNASFILASYVFPESPSNRDEGALVWMANRHRPVSGNFSLTLNQTSGNLVLLDGDGSVAWFSNNSYTPRGSVSMDLKTDPSGYPPIGTLVLSDANTTLWQSSDHPTDTLITPQFLEPGMNLISWASTSDPSDGLFRLAMEAGGLALYYNSMPYWVWSYYGRNDSFGVTHTCRNLTNAFMDPEGGLMLEVTSNLSSLDTTSTDLCPANNTTPSRDEAYFDDYGSRGNNDVTLLQLQHDGNLVAYTLGSPWVTVYDLFVENRCLLPNYCGPYGVCTAPSNCQCPPSSDGSFPGTFPLDRSQGCPPIHTFSCSSAVELKLMPLSGVDYFSNKYSSPLTNLPTQDLCQAGCLQNCSCLAAFWHVHTSSCFHSSDVMGLQGSLNSSYMAFIKVEHLPESKLNRRLIVGIVLGAASLFIVMILAVIIICRKRRANLEQEEDEDPFWKYVPGLPNRYSYKDLESITNGFSEKMGKGGFGAVYSGVLQDGTKVAVKRLESLRQGKKEFRAEVVILGGVHHYNLVGLIGFCAEGTHRLLVYEYMANGSLDQWLFARDKAPLEWKHRFNIALGAARGLAYLHGECKDTIVHLDIKPENILLDEDFVAKVADFGLATLMSRNETHVITTMRGTPGYLAPEWIAEGFQISAKCDVFSFGKLLMEILGARRNLQPSLSEETDNKPYFPSWLYLNTTHQGKEVDLTQIARVKSSEEMRQARLMMKTSFLCVLENPGQRPSMEKVVHMLEGRVPELDDLDLSELFQGLQFALRMPSPSLAQTRIEEALAPLYRTLSLEFVRSHPP